MKQRVEGALVASYPLAIFAACLVVVPIVYLGLRAAEMQNATAALWRSELLFLILRSLGLAFSVSITSILLSLPLVFLTRSNMPGARIFAVLVPLPLAIPSYVAALAYIATFGAGGVASDLLGLQAWSGIYGFVGAWLVLTLFTFPYVYLTLNAALERVDGNVVDAARSLGCSQIQAIVRTVIPLLLPACLSGGLLVALYVLSDFGAVSLMRYDTFTRVIYTQYQTTLDRSGTALYALVLIGLTLLLLVASHQIHKRWLSHMPTHGRQPRPLRLELGRSRYLACLYPISLIILSLALPVFTLFTWLLRGSDSAWPLKPFANAALVALAAASLAILLAFPIAYIYQRKKSWLSLVLERVSFIGFALPGIVVGLAFVFLATRHFLFLYQTLLLLVLAYVVRFLPQAISATNETLHLVPSNIENAARALGANSLQTLGRVTLPLALPGILGGFSLVFLTTIKELPATIILSPPEFRTLATEVWSYTEEAFFAEAALPALVLIFLAATPTLLQTFFATPKNGTH